MALPFSISAHACSQLTFASRSAIDRPAGGPMVRRALRDNAFCPSI